MTFKDTDSNVLKADVEKYQNRFSWLKDSKFIQDLENDSVDSELLDEELSALQEEEILTSRQKLVKCLQSNPVQILLCVVVLLDAGIVIAQILLDLHSVREKLHRREQDITHLLSYIRETTPTALRGYDGDNVKHILEILADHKRWENLTEQKNTGRSGQGGAGTRTSSHNTNNPPLPPRPSHGGGSGLDAAPSSDRANSTLHHRTSGGSAARTHRSVHPVGPPGGDGGGELVDDRGGFSNNIHGILVGDNSAGVVHGASAGASDSSTRRPWSANSFRQISERTHTGDQRGGGHDGGAAAAVGGGGSGSSSNVADRTPGSGSGAPLPPKSPTGPDVATGVAGGAGGQGGAARNSNNNNHSNDNKAKSSTSASGSAGPSSSSSKKHSSMGEAGSSGARREIVEGPEDVGAADHHKVPVPAVQVQAMPLPQQQPPQHQQQGGNDGGHVDHHDYMQDIVGLTRTRRDKEENDSKTQDVSYNNKKRQHTHSYTDQEEHDTLHEVAHGLHFASISLLGFLVVEDLVKIIAMGKEFFKHKIEIFDAIIITSSFAFDIIFLGGVTGEEGEKAAAVLVVLLLWRITRVIDGILITAKQRQEFRIRLQKRARRKAEKRIDLLEDEKHTRARQITLLKELCSRAGVTEDDIELCTPKRPRRVSNTLCALSSVARLSVSMTMSMSSGLFSMAEEDSEKSDENRDSSHGKYDKFLDPGGPSEEGYALELYKPERRHSLPVPGKMSDIEEESRSSMQGEDSDSPVNACGVRIIIEDEPSDTQSADEAETAQETLLEASDGTMTNDRRISQFSEVHLLA